MEWSDPRWGQLLGAYRQPYDPRDALRKLESGDAASAWNELWQELHHQGDVGASSYAAVPHLVRIHRARNVPDWNSYALAATIEEARHNGRNPDVPNWLRPEYEQAWRELLELALAEFRAASDHELVDSIIAVLALSKGRLMLGRLAADFTEDERRELLREAGWS